MKIGLKIVIGFGIFTGIIALIMLISGNWDGLFGTLVTSIGFIGLGWAGYRLLLPAKNKSPRQSISLVIGVVFGGAGSLMLLGSILLFVDGEFEGAIGLSIFGVVFCIVAYVGSRIFSIPKDKKEILVGQRTRTIRGVFGQSGRLTSGRYIYVDQETPDAEIESMQKKWAEKPWTQRDDWAEGKVIQQGPGSTRFLIGFTILWNIIAWGIAAFGILSEWGTTDVPWFLLVFPAIGIGLAIMTVRTWIRRRKFGISILHLKTVPAYLGEWLHGTVKTGVPVRNQTAKEFRVRLVCARRTSRLDSDGKRRVSEDNIWKEEQMVFGSISETAFTFDVSVNFAIPDSLPPSELFPEDDRTLWRLEVTAAVRGVNYAAQFEVPVYKKE